MEWTRISTTMSMEPTIEALTTTDIPIKITTTRNIQIILIGCGLTTVLAEKAKGSLGESIRERKFQLAASKRPVLCF